MLSNFPQYVTFIIHFKSNMIIKSVSKETKMFHSQHLALIKRYLLSTVEEKMVRFVSHKNANVRKSLSFYDQRLAFTFTLKSSRNAHK